MKNGAPLLKHAIQISIRSGHARVAVSRHKYRQGSGNKPAVRTHRRRARTALPGGAGRPLDQSSRVALPDVDTERLDLFWCCHGPGATGPYGQVACCASRTASQVPSPIDHAPGLVVDATVAVVEDQDN